MSGGTDPSLDFKIRSFQDSDRDDVVSLWGRCGLIVPWNDSDQDLALWSESTNAEILIGELEGRVVATTCVGHDGHRGWLYSLATDPGLRKSGIGRRMVRHAEHWLIERKIRKVQLMIRPTNQAVRDFYHSIGYEHTPRTVMARRLVNDLPETEPVVAGDGAGDGKIETTITYLEMLGRPAISPVHPPRNIKVALMRAVSPSTGFYRYLYDSVGEPWLWWERRAMDDEALAAIVHDDDVEIYVLYVEGVPAGFAELDRRDPADIELAYFGLLPEFVGRGLGPYLLYVAMEIAWDHEPKRLWVNTCTLDHPKALSLYQRMGFQPYKQEDKVIDDPRLTGAIHS